MIHNTLLRLLWAGSVVVLCAGPMHGQPTQGTTGLLNIPSAEMQLDGTFMVGANYLPDEMTPSSFPYNTANYYLDVTFLPFFEFSYRMTIFKMSGGNLNQDRSFGMRFRLLRERRWIPSLVVGGNDLYSSSGKGAEYFNALYGVVTKHIDGEKGSIGLTAGYGHQGFGKERSGNLKGLFGGVTVSPAFAPTVRLIGEYDSHVINAGISATLFKHLCLYGMLYDLRIPTAGFALQISRKDKGERRKAKVKIHLIYLCYFYNYIIFYILVT